MVKGIMTVCAFNCACLIGHVSVSLSAPLFFSLQVTTVCRSVCNLFSKSSYLRCTLSTIDKAADSSVLVFCKISFAFCALFSAARREQTKKAKLILEEKNKNRTNRKNEGKKFQRDQATKEPV